MSVVWENSARHLFGLGIATKVLGQQKAAGGHYNMYAFWVIAASKL
jgi:hypothetical protein